MLQRIEDHHILWRITAPHFCAGILVWNNVVMNAAPILAWMKGRHTTWINGYCTRKGWTVEYVEGETDEQKQ